MLGSRNDARMYKTKVFVEIGGEMLTKGKYNDEIDSPSYRDFCKSLDDIGR